MLPSDSNAQPDANPYAGFTGIVCGERFVGRTGPLLEIEQRIVTSQYPGCVSIVGQPRIGKSSLAWQSLLHRKEALHQRRLLPVWLPIGECQQPHEFFLILLLRAQEQLGRIGAYSPVLEKIHRAALQVGSSSIEFNNELTNYFNHLHEIGWTAIFVLDEFDSARTLFHDYPQAFQAMRGLADRPDSRVCFVAISRRALYEIERKADPHSSILSGIFHKISLSCFAPQEAAQLLERLSTVKLGPTPRLLDFVIENCGNHPYLSCILAFHLARIWMSLGLEDLDGALLSSRSQFLDHYNEIRKLLEDEGNLQKMLEVVFGPVVTATASDADRLEQTGIIRPSGDGYYEGFAKHFTDYLRSLHRSCDLWPLWGQTESALRGLVSTKMADLYKSSDWSDSVAQERPKLRETIAEWKALRSRERLSLGERASDVLIDYAMPKDLWQIMKSYRPLFAPVLGHDEQYWEVGFKTLFEARNRMAHGRSVHVDAGVRKHAEEYCKEIVESIRVWQRTISQTAESD